MTSTRPERSPLVVGICAYELFAVAASLVGEFISYSLPQHDLAVQHSGQPWRVAATWLSVAFALAAAIALWHLRRVAAFLLAGRFIIALSLFIHGLVLAHTSPDLLPQSNVPIDPTTILHVVQVISFVIVLFSGAIAATSFVVLFKPSIKVQHVETSHGH